MRTMRDASRQEFTTKDGALGYEAINGGSLQRIADACELMARDREEMERLLARRKERLDYWSERCERAERSNAGLRGYITRLKKKLAAAEGGE